MATQLNQPLSKSMSAIARINTWAAKIACSSTCGSIIHRSRISYFIIYCSLYPRYNICGVMVLSRDPCILFSDKGFRWIDNYFAMDISRIYLSSSLNAAFHTAKSAHMDTVFILCYSQSCMQYGTSISLCRYPTTRVILGSIVSCLVRIVRGSEQYGKITGMKIGLTKFYEQIHIYLKYAVEINVLCQF